MQNALLDSFAVIPVLASLLVQGIAAVLFFRIRANAPEKLPRKAFFSIPLIILAIMAASSLIALFIPSLTIYSGGMLVASAFALALILALAAYKPTVVSDTGTDERNNFV